MDMSRELRTGRHCVFSMHCHLVFVTKYRKKIFTKEILDDMRSCLEKICCGFEASLEEFDGEHDHVHLLVYYPPKVSISKLVNSLKGISSRMLRKKNYPTIQKNLQEEAKLINIGLVSSNSSKSIGNTNGNYNPSVSQNPSLQKMKSLSKINFSALSSGNNLPIYSESNEREEYEKSRNSKKL